MIAMNRPNGVREGWSRSMTLILCGLAATLLCSGPAFAATLEVEGPAGAELFVDGERVGVLPLAGPIAVEPGIRTLECRKPGHLVHTEAVNIDGPETTLSVHLELEPLSRRRALGSSVALAGLGQLYQGRTRMGWTMVALQGSAWLVVAAAEGSFQSKRDDYEILDRRYQDAILQSEITRLRGERQAAFDDIESAKNLRNAALGAVVVIGVWSLFDVWRAHSGFYADAEVPERVESASATGSLEATQWRLGWRTNF